MEWNSTRKQFDNSHLQLRNFIKLFAFHVVSPHFLSLSSADSSSFRLVAVETNFPTHRSLAFCRVSIGDGMEIFIFSPSLLPTDCHLKSSAKSKLGLRVHFNRVTWSIEPLEISSRSLRRSFFLKFFFDPITFRVADAVCEKLANILQQSLKFIVNLRITPPKLALPCKANLALREQQEKNENLLNKSVNKFLVGPDFSSLRSLSLSAQGTQLNLIFSPKCEAQRQVNRKKG